MRKGHAKLEERAEQLRSEIANLQSTGAPDKKTATALRETRDELELVEQKLAESDHAATSTLTPETDRASQLMREISLAIQRALQPVMDARLDETVKILRPLFVDDVTTRGAAWQTPYYSQLCGYCSRSYGRSLGAPPSHIKACLEFCDEVLSGELKFSFDPKTK